MNRHEDDLEALLGRAERKRGGSYPTALPLQALGHCECGARISLADVYGERGAADLGQSRRLPAARVVLFHCPLCGRSGELESSSIE